MATNDSCENDNTSMSGKESFIQEKDVKEAEMKKNKKERKQSIFVGRVIEVRDKQGPLQAAIPVVPRFVAWFCLFCNVFVPGLGTFFMAISALLGAKTNSKEPNQCLDFLFNFLSSLLQIATALIIVGWILSISWGMQCVTLANEAYIKQKRSKKKSQNQIFKSNKV